ncbi:MAG: 2-C-methyl-D-erythritol 4-phosphate cytidylyltransferase, partial [Ilumatobacteraceae bacterium]|nr:2-C-methyl-D-erythritol 4-phosphate cytidylyltransferase [Ilumatobacteraceae bacterium]
MPTGELRRPGEIIWTIVVAAGAGTRFGGPKQFESLGDRRVIDWSIAVARESSDGVIVVLPPQDAEREGGVAGGATRSESVRRGLAAVPKNAT